MDFFWENMKVYGFLLLALSFVTFVFHGMAIDSKKVSDNFMKNKKLAKARVVGYDSRDLGTDNLIVQLLDIGDDGMYSCSSEHLNWDDYPVGKIVDVYYAPLKMFGVVAKDIQLKDRPPEITVEKASKVLFFLRNIFLILTLGLLCLAVGHALILLLKQ